MLAVLGSERCDSVPNRVQCLRVLRSFQALKVLSHVARADGSSARLVWTKSACLPGIQEVFARFSFQHQQ